MKDKKIRPFKKSKQFIIPSNSTKTTVVYKAVNVFLSLVFFLHRFPRKENLPEVSQRPSAVEVSLGVIGGGAAKSIRRRRVAVLTNVAAAFVPLIGGLVDQRQVEMEQGVSRQEEEDEDDEAQHEDDSGESEKKMLEEQRGGRNMSEEEECSFVQM